MDVLITEPINQVQQGFAYVVANKYGHEFLLSATFAKSKTQSKRFLKFLQNQRCRANVPMLEPLALAQVTLTINSIEREL